MSKNSLAPVHTIAKLAMAFAVVVSLLLLGLYSFHIGRPHNFAFSTASSEWSNFGSYAGGVLGPLFSFLAFAGVLLTNWLQGKQLEHLQGQTGIEEFQRVIANLSLQIDSFLREKIDHIPAGFNVQGKPEVLYTYLMIAGTAAVRNSPDNVIQASDKRIVDAIRPAINSQITLISFELNQLAWSIDEFKRLGGSDSVCRLYQIRYNPIVCWLDALSFLGSHPEIEKVWDVALLRRAFQE